MEQSTGHAPAVRPLDLDPVVEGCELVAAYRSDMYAGGIRGVALHLDRTVFACVEHIEAVERAAARRETFPAFAGRVREAVPCGATFVYADLLAAEAAA